MPRETDTRPLARKCYARGINQPNPTVTIGGKVLEFPELTLMIVYLSSSVLGKSVILSGLLSPGEIRDSADEAN